MISKRLKTRSWQQFNNSRVIQHPSYINEYIIQIETQKENSDFKGDIRPDRFDSLIQKFLLNAAEYMFFSRAYGSFSRINHMLGHKTSLNKAGNHIKHSSWSQWYKMRNQLQEQSWRKPQISGDWTTCYWTIG